MAPSFLAPSPLDSQGGSSSAWWSPPSILLPNTFWYSNMAMGYLPFIDDSPSSMPICHGDVPFHVWLPGLPDGKVNATTHDALQICQQGCPHDILCQLSRLTSPQWWPSPEWRSAGASRPTSLGNPAPPHRARCWTVARHSAGPVLGWIVHDRRFQVFRFRFSPSSTFGESSCI